MIGEGQEITTIRKDNVFMDEVTEEEKSIIEQRVALQRKHYLEYERRELATKYRKVVRVHPYVTEEEVKYSLKQCKEDESEVIVYLTDYFNLQSVRKQIALEYEKQLGKNNKNYNYGDNNRYESEDMELEEGRFISRKRKNKTTPARSRRSGDKKEGTYVYRKLRLDDALAQGNFEGWSQARIRAYQLKDKNPNAYYYRFNDPGEKQRNGPWTKEEINLFNNRVQKVGVNGQWGIFSMGIPGRVGYQCSNFYRHLIETHKVVDPNYVIDDKGKAHFIFKGGKRNSRKASEDNDENNNGNNNNNNSNGTNTNGDTKPKFVKRKRKNKRRKFSDNDNGSDNEEGDEDDDEYRPSASYSRRKNTEENQDNNNNDNSADNPLPGFIDPITLEEVEKPALSPHGHVMSYNTWVRCLLQEPKNTCPFTKKQFTKRDLVVLTWENIEQYKDKIVNWS